MRELVAQAEDMKLKSRELDEQERKRSALENFAQEFMMLVAPLAYTIVQSKFGPICPLPCGGSPFSLDCIRAIPCGGSPFSLDSELVSDRSLIPKTMFGIQGSGIVKCIPYSSPKDSLPVYGTLASSITNSGIVTHCNDREVRYSV